MERIGANMENYSFFRKWFDEQTWYHEGDCEEALMNAWCRMAIKGMSAEEITSILDLVILAIRGEYGE